MFATDGQIFAAAALSCAAVLIWMTVAAIVHRRRLAAVPVRIHVAGSRGKTSTARLIGAGLRKGGRRVVVKTTGTVPLLILPDGSERRWDRLGPPTIAEQARFFSIAVRLGADTVVLESMAIDPEYLWASEHYLVRATHAVVTNLRPDHAEVLGDGKLAMTAGISLVIPRGGQVFLTEEAAVDSILETCAGNKNRVEIVPVADLPPLESNRRLALAVCGALGVPADVAGPAMDEAGEDPGSFFIADVNIAGHNCRFASAFACNDTTSFMELWAEHRPAGPAVALLTARHDRPLRTRAFLETLARLQPPVRLFLSSGAPTRWALAAGFAPDRVQRLRAGDARRALVELVMAAGPGGTVWGVGNYADLGARIVEQVRHKDPAC